MLYYHMTCRHFQGKVVQHNLLWPGGISEGDVAKLDVTKERVVGYLFPALKWHAWLKVDVFKHSASRREP